jgi:hypothetical protein
MSVPLKAIPTLLSKFPSNNTAEMRIFWNRSVSEGTDFGANGGRLTRFGGHEFSSLLSRSVGPPSVPENKLAGS